MSERYAVNLADLSEAGFIVTMMIAPHIQGRQTVEAEPGRVDGSAVVLDCPAEQAAAIVEIIRRRIHRNRLRLYKSNGGERWNRV